MLRVQNKNKNYKNFENNKKFKVNNIINRIVDTSNWNQNPIDF